MADVRKHFTSPRALSEWIVKTKAETGWEPSPWSFSARPEAQLGVQALADGDTRNVQQAQDLLQHFQENIDVPAQKWELSMVGAFPSVPAYIAGVPEVMWSQQPVVSDRSPLRVWIGVTSSAAIQEEQLVKRGCTLAAFAIAMSSRRPVYITPYVCNSDGFSEHAIISWDVQSTPLVLSDLLASVSNPHCTRHAGLMATYIANPRTHGAWDPRELTGQVRNQYQTNTRHAISNSHQVAAIAAAQAEGKLENKPKTEWQLNCLGAKEEDLVLGSIHLYDELVSDPISWLRRAIATYGSDDEQ